MRYWAICIFLGISSLPTRARFTLPVACQRPLIEPLNLQGERTKKLFQV